MQDFFDADALDKMDGNDGQSANQGAAAAASGEAGSAGAGEGGASPAGEKTTEQLAKEAADKAAAGGSDEGNAGADGAGANENKDGDQGGAAGAGEGGTAAAGEKTAEEIAKEQADKAAAEEAKKPNTDEIAKKAEADLLKKLGVKSVDELQKKLNPETDEQRQKRLEAEKAAVNNYAVQKGYLKNSDIVNLETMKSMSKDTLVYNKFASAYKDQFKDRLDELEQPKPVTEEEVKEAFNAAYHINSDNAAMKKVGQQMIEKQASEIIGDLEEKYKEIEEEYRDVTFKQGKSKQYFSFVEDFVTQNMPTELTYGDGADKITYKFDTEKFTAKDREELKRFFINDKNFNDFIETGANQKMIASMKEGMMKYLKFLHHDRIVGEISKLRYEAGLSAGSTTGAKAPFETKKEIPPVQVTDSELTDAEKRDLADSGMFSGNGR